MSSARYIGRFAPSPTGPLHFGSLLAAMASYCDARQQNGIWQLRIDDIDPLREMPGARAGIQHTLSSYGFVWDGPAIEQSERTEQYLEKLHQLNRQRLLFPCTCSRKKLSDNTIYPGYCNPAASALSIESVSNKVQLKLDGETSDYALRIMLNSKIGFDDRIQGAQIFDDGHPGDTIVVRRDNLFAYALACAIDDSEKITHVVRGSDLLPTTAAQIAIMEHLNLTPPAYAHIPVALNNDGQKLSKQTYAQALDEMPCLPTLLSAWQFLGQCELKVNSVEAFWIESVKAWQISKVPKQSQHCTSV